MRAARRAGAAAIVAVVALVAASAANAYPTSGFTIWTIAGDGFGCASATATCGDGSAATDARLDYPAGVAVDAGGDVFIADSQSERIRKVTPAGVISTVAGNGSLCASPTSACGDGGRAVDASLRAAEGVAVNSSGTIIYIADTGDDRIRMVGADGLIATIAGDGTACTTPSDGCGDGGRATSAQLGPPGGLAVDPGGDVYIADTTDNKIREVAAATGTISLIAGNGADCGTSTSTCGDGPATAANLTDPGAVAVDGRGDVYIADSGDSKVREVDAASGVMSTIAGNGNLCAVPTGGCGDGPVATNATVSNPAGVAVDAGGDVFVTDAADKVREISPTGAISTAAGSGNFCTTAPSCGDGGSATAGELNTPFGVAVDPAGDLLVGDQDDQEIRWLTGPQPSPAGPPGPSGPAGPSGTGAAGPTGPAAPAPQPVAALVLLAYRTATSSRSVLVRYAITGPATVALRVKPPRGATVTVARGRARSGLDHLTWNRRLHGKRAARGSYRLTVSASASGVTTSSSITVRLR